MDQIVPCPHATATLATERVCLTFREMSRPNAARLDGRRFTGGCPQVRMKNRLLYTGLGP